MFENEWFPKAYAYGVTWEQFWGMNPRIIKLIIKGHEERVKEIDGLAWMFGQYVHSAVAVAVEHCLAGRKAHSKYIEKPFLQQADEKKQVETGNMSETEKKKQVELLFMKLQVMGSNFNRQKKQEEQGVAVS